MNTNILLNNYRNKRVFLTGHTGFKGAWLLAYLTNLGALVKGYAIEPEEEWGIYNCIDGDKLCESVIADIRSKDRLKKEVIDFQPDIIFHLAAQPLVRVSYDIPVETFEINAIGTANLLDAIRFLDKPCTVIIITTDKVYENKEWEYPYRENDNLGGYDPYSASKACAEIVTNSYRSSFFNPAHIETHQKGIATARAGNVIGGGDWAKDRIIPDIIRALIAHKEVVVRNPTAIRPWQLVLEPLYGYLLLGMQLFHDPHSFSAAFNFGPHVNEELKVEQLVNVAIDKWGFGEYRTPEVIGPHEAGILKLDISKAVKMLCWEPKLDSKRAINFTIDWYKCFNTDRAMIKEFTFNQIQEYSTL